jgi:RNA polymerase sigma-70 factor (ECF subfamily)
VAVNRSIQEARRNKHKHRNVELTDTVPAHEPQDNEDSDPRVHSAMSSIAPADRALLVLFYWEELSLQEIADSIGCNVNAAKTRLYRARERFRAQYEATQ